jgi:uncharacterized protein (UPF0261 family)
MTIVVVGMLDEREEALSVLKEHIEQKGHETLLIDISIGTGAISSSLKAEVTNDEVAEAGGANIDEIRQVLAKEREKATSMMAQGLSSKVLECYRSGRLDGIIAVGGMTGTFLSLTAMKVLPFGVPKVLISSTVAMPAYAKRLAEYLGLRDITVMNTVVDTVGLNPLVRRLMVNGAGAICGMVQEIETDKKEDRPAVALTEFGFCDQCAHYVREGLEQENYSPISFHATGLGDRAAEDLVDQGFLDAFIDLVPASLSEHILGGNRDAGPHRLEAAVNQAIPYILAPCGFDMISCGPIERRDKEDPLWVSRKLADRKLLLQDAMRVQARTSAEEMESVARVVAEKLNRHGEKRLVKFLIPTRGFSSLSGEGGVLYDPEADQAFIDELKKNLDPDIGVIEIDAHINTREFSGAVVEALKDSFKYLSEKK